MNCIAREGKKRCIWCVSGCINPTVPSEVKLECSKTTGTLPRC
jgi:hypothetical protein